MRVKLNNILEQEREEWEESEEAPGGLEFILLTFFSLFLSAENLSEPEENGLK